MATDYDAPRKNVDDEDTDSLVELETRRKTSNSADSDEDETVAAEYLELPAGDLSAEELVVRALPIQEDEFTCSTCFLVHHRSQLFEVSSRGRLVCNDCAT